MTAVLLSAGLSVIYLIVIRLLDFNEREALWGIVLLFLLGWAAAGVVQLTVPTATIELSTWGGAGWKESAKFVAIVVGLGLIVTAGRSQGWSEVNGGMDGIVYGAAAGLGFATGETLIQELMWGAGGTGAAEVSVFSVLWRTALAGLAHGVFGAIIGAGVAGAIVSRSVSGRLGLPLVALAVAILASVAYRVLAYGAPLSGAGSFARTWIALLLPVVLVALVAAYSLTRERRAIAQELIGEEASGVVTSEEQALLTKGTQRLGLYLAMIISGRASEWAALRRIHNKQVQLALIKRRVSHEGDGARKASLEAQAQRIRQAITDRKQSFASLASVVVLVIGLALLCPGALYAQGSDGDGDGIPDASDRCPNQRETVNGFNDLDGCPDTFDELFEFGRGTVEDYWRERMPAHGSTYGPPASINLYDQMWITACDTVGPNNAFYCGADRSVSFHRGFMEDQFAAGDFIPVVIIAHEWAHMAQHDLGMFYLDRPTIFNELQADCFAGSYSRYADRQGYLSPGDVQEALFGLFMAGSTNVGWLHPASHGTGGERSDAFWWGFRFQSDGCTGSMFNAAAGRPDDRFAFAVPEGPLQDEIPRPAVGSYTLITCKKRHELIGEAGTTDAMACRYRSEAGQDIDLELIAKAGTTSASSMYDHNVSRWLEQGYTIFDWGDTVNDSGTVVGNYHQLRSGDLEIWWQRIGDMLVYIKGARAEVAKFLNGA